MKNSYLYVKYKDMSLRTTLTEHIQKSTQLFSFLRYTVARQDTKLYESMRAGVTREVPHTLSRDAQLHFEHKEKLMITRERNEENMKQVVAKQYPSALTLEGLRAFVPDKLRNPILDKAMSILSWHVVTNVQDAEVFVMDDPEQLGAFA